MRKTLHLNVGTSELYKNMNCPLNKLFSYDRSLIISLTGLSALSIAFGKPNVMATSLTLELDFGESLQVISSSSNCLFYYPASVVSLTANVNKYENFYFREMSHIMWKSFMV